MQIYGVGRRDVLIDEHRRWGGVPHLAKAYDEMARRSAVEELEPDDRSLRNLLRHATNYGKWVAGGRLGCGIGGGFGCHLGFSF